VIFTTGFTGVGVKVGRAVGTVVGAAVGAMAVKSRVAGSRLVAVGCNSRGTVATAATVGKAGDGVLQAVISSKQKARTTNLLIIMPIISLLLSEG
jgi:hypothetical protein